MTDELMKQLIETGFGSVRNEIERLGREVKDVKRDITTINSTMVQYLERTVRLETNMVTLCREHEELKQDVSSDNVDVKRIITNVSDNVREVARDESRKEVLKLKVAALSAVALSLLSSLGTALMILLKGKTQ